MAKSVQKMYRLSEDVVEKMEIGRQVWAAEVGGNEKPTFSNFIAALISQKINWEKVVKIQDQDTKKCLYTTDKFLRRLRKAAKITGQDPEELLNKLLDRELSEMVK